MATPFRLDRALIRVSGPETRSFLNNLLTQNLDGLDEAGVLYGALLTPQGKIIADMLIWSDGEDVVLDADPTRVDDLLRRLTMYKLRAQVSVARDDARNVLWSDTAFDVARADPRFADGALGYRQLAAADEGAPSGTNALEGRRLALGVPDLARDAQPDEVFALEALLEELNGVDFQKGCFVGQENVSRMKRRATTRKKFCAVTFEGEAPAPMTPVRAGDADLGTVRSGGAGRAIALLRLDRALEAVEAGKTLTAGEREISLDPPAWLILPPRDAA